MECLFLTTLVVTFIVTAITVRIPPLSRKPDTYVTEEGFPEPVYKEKMLERAWEDALEVSKSAPYYEKYRGEFKRWIYYDNGNFTIYYVSRFNWYRLSEIHANI